MPRHPGLRYYIRVETAHPTQTIANGQAAYPDLLKQIHDPPSPLYYRGSLTPASLPSISIVGSRKMSLYGERVVRLLVPSLVRAGLSIVSGLAYGIDVTAHQVALESGGSCVAVLGSGADIVYPERNRDTYRKILQTGGCIFSEYPDGTAPKPFHFPARNRIVAGLSMVTLIVEAGEKSGTLLTARSALEGGREVAVVPGDITRDTSLGVNRLLREGATPVTSVEDVLELFQLHLPLYEGRKRPPNLTGLQSTLYDLISCEPSTVDRLVARSRKTLQEVLAAVTELELAGVIKNNGSIWHLIL